jgi:hypothetical protein
MALRQPIQPTLHRSAESLSTAQAGERPPPLDQPNLVALDVPRRPDPPEDADSVPPLKPTVDRAVAAEPFGRLFNWQPLRRRKMMHLIACRKSMRNRSPWALGGGDAASNKMGSMGAQRSSDSSQIVSSDLTVQAALPKSSAPNVKVHRSSVPSQLRSCPGHTRSEEARAQWMRLVPFMLMISSIMGCIRTSSNQPLTTADLERMAVGKVVLARLERVGNHSAVSLENDPSGISSRILRSMSPVISSNAAVSSEIATEYRFMFQSGRNPIDFSICVCGDVLCYRVGNTDYKGGNAKDFLSAVGELKWTPMTISVP